MGACVVATRRFALTPTPIRITGIAIDKAFQMQNRGPGIIHISTALQAVGQPDSDAEFLMSHIIEEYEWLNYARVFDHRVDAWSDLPHADLIITEGTH